MPPRVTRRGRGVTRYPVRSSVRNITNLAQWNRLHKRGKNQLIFVMYTLEYVRNSHRLKTTLVELSGQNEFSDVIFAVVDIERAKEVAENEGITDAPTFVCYRSNTIVEKLERVSGDSAASALWQMLHRNAARVRNETGRRHPEAERNNTHWHTLGKAVAFLGLVLSSTPPSTQHLPYRLPLGAIAAVVFMKTSVDSDDKIKDTTPRKISQPSRQRYDFSESSDEE